MKKPDIMFLIYDLERGGPEVRLLELADNLSDKLNFHICVTSNNLSMLRDFEKTGAQIDVVPVAKPYREISKLAAIRKIVRERDIRVINTFDLKGLLIASLIRPFLGTKTSIIYNNVNCIDSFSLKNRIILKLAGKNINKILSNSWFSFNQIKDYFPGIGGKVIHNGVETETYNRSAQLRTQIRAKYNLTDNNFLIGTVANFRPQKNYEFLIRTFSQFVQRHPEARLLCAGGGPLLEQMQKLARDADVSEQIIFTGYSNEIPALLSAMDLFVLASEFEGLPNGILQAMSAELPIISTDVGGCSELISNMETGILIESDNSQQLDAAFTRLIEDSDLCKQLSFRAKQVVEEKFSHQAMLNNYLDFYTDIEQS